MWDNLPLQKPNFNSPVVRYWLKFCKPVFLLFPKFSIIVLTGYSCDPYSHPILLWILHSSWPQCFLWWYLPLSNYTLCEREFHLISFEYMRSSFHWMFLYLVLCSKLERNVRYFFSRIFDILSYCVPSYLPLFWDKQISFLSISSGDSLCLYPYTLWPPTRSFSFLLSDLYLCSAGSSRAWEGAWTVCQRRIQYCLSSRTSC